MLGLIAAAMAVNNQRGGTFRKRAAQRVHTGNDERHRLHDLVLRRLRNSVFAFTAPSLGISAISSDKLGAISGPGSSFIFDLTRFPAISTSYGFFAAALSWLAGL